MQPRSRYMAAHARAPILAWMGDCSKWAEWINIFPSPQRESAVLWIFSVKIKLKNEKTDHGRLMQTTLAHWAHSPIYAEMGARLLGARAWATVTTHFMRQSEYLFYKLRPRMRECGKFEEGDRNWGGFCYEKKEKKKTENIHENKQHRMREGWQCVRGEAVCFSRPDVDSRHLVRAARPTPSRLKKREKK